MSDDDFDARVELIAQNELAADWVEPERHFLPSDLEQIPVGPYLAAILASVDVSRLNGYDAVRLMQAQARLGSHHEAGKLSAMAEVACSPPGDPDSPVEREPLPGEYAAAEVAAALTLTRRAADALLDQALTLRDRLQRVWERLSDGLIDGRKAREFVNRLSHLPDEVTDEVLDETLDDAADLTTGQLRAGINREVMIADSDGAASAYEEGLTSRRVTTYSNPDFTGSLAIHSAEPLRVAAANSYVDALARGLKTKDDPRSLDEIKADVALDLLSGHCLCGSAPKSGGKTNLKVSASTLAGLSDAPGELGGYGPVLAEMARKAALTRVDGDWTYTVTDNGQVLATGTLSRRPTAAQARHVRADKPKCVWVGCRQDAEECDLDHRHPHGRGGRTHVANLEPLCRHHHMVKHHTLGRSKNSRMATTNGPALSATPTSAKGTHRIERRGASG